MLDGRPPGHVQPDLADELEGGMCLNPVDTGQVHPCDSIQVAASIERRCVVLGPPALFLGLRRQRPFAPALERVQKGFDLPVAFGYLALVSGVKLYCLGELEQVFVSPMAVQRLCYLRFASLSPIVSEFGQLPGVALPCNDGPNNVHPGLTSNVAHYVLKLYVHLRQRLLHMLDVPGCVLDQHGPLAKVAPKLSDVLLRSESPAEKAIGMEPLQPLAVHPDASGRPGTFLSLRGSTRMTSNPRSSNTPNSGIQYTPVDSIATVSTPQLVSQPASLYRSEVNALNSWTGRSSRSGGTATKWLSAPTSIPAAFGFMGESSSTFLRSLTLSSIATTSTVLM